jgi:hypothetical protein
VIVGVHVDFQILVAFPNHPEQVHPMLQNLGSVNDGLISSRCQDLAPLRSPMPTRSWCSWYKSRHDWLWEGLVKLTSLLKIAAVLLATILTTFLQQESKAQTSSAEEEIRAIEALKLQYPLEPARWSSSVDDDAVFTQGNGKVISKAELLSNYREQGNSLKNSTEMTEPKFQRFGDTSVFSYVYTRTEQEGRYLLHYHVRRTAVYQLTQSHWRLIASSSIAIHNADRKQKPVDPKILDTYVGLYENDLRITRDGTRIMAQDPKDKEKVELLAVSNEAFAVAGEANSILFVFEKGDDGRIQIREHNIGGSESLIKRINDK